jgi:hypothetical protein
VERRLRQADEKKLLELLESLLEDLERGLEPRPAPNSTTPSDRQMEEAWGNLTSHDPIMARKASNTLFAAKQCVPFVQERLVFKPVKVDSDRVSALIARLDSDAYLEREHAAEALLTMGPEILPLLEKSLRVATSCEVAHRLEVVLAMMENTKPVLQTQRAIEILEALPGNAPRRLLEKLRGSSATWVSERAKTALARMPR